MVNGPEIGYATQSIPINIDRTQTRLKIYRVSHRGNVAPVGPLGSYRTGCAFIPTRQTQLSIRQPLNPRVSET